MIEAVVFDMDGILFDTERLVSECWNEVAVKMQIKDLDAILKACIGLNKKATRALFLEKLGHAFDFNQFDKMAHDAFINKVKREGLPIKTGVYELLDYLKQVGFKIGLASSTSVAGVRSHLKEAKIEDYFQVIVGGDMVTNGKPDPEIYLRACRELGVVSENAIAIEDSHNGIRAAHAAGMKTVMVPDLMPLTEEIEPLLYQNMESLLKVRDFFENLQ